MVASDGARERNAGNPRMPHEGIVIQDREELFYLLAEAAKLEHAAASVLQRHCGSHRLPPI